MKEYRIYLPTHLKERKLETKNYILAQHYLDGIFTSGFCGCVLGVGRYDFQTKILGSLKFDFAEEDYDDEDFDVEEKQKRKPKLQHRLIIADLLPLIGFYKQAEPNSNKKKGSGVILKFLLPDCVVPEEREFQIYCAIKLLNGKYITKDEAVQMSGYPEAIFDDLFIVFEARYMKMCRYGYSDVQYKEDQEEDEEEE
ncbi:MAG: hypothetical protein LBI14_11910 [Treponema sp.]|jgi:hypothetical protein|nr:hypothetical protein [Treponema sp.]